jgi:hypothetical protein
VHDYRFAGEWRIHADAQDVLRALADISSYPQWWRGITVTHCTDADDDEVRWHGTLTSGLTVTVSRSVLDPVRRILVVRMTGRFHGTERWEIFPVVGGSRARHYEHFAIDAGPHTHSGLLARPVVHAIHDRLMRDGERGLVHYLERAA